MSKKMPKYDHVDITDSVSLAAPQARMVILHAYWDSEDDHEASFTPVLAIKASIHRYYRRSYTGSVREYSTTSDLVDDGWRSNGHETKFDYVILDPTGNEYGLCVPQDTFDGVNVAWEPVLCPWPSDQDSERLAPMMEALTQKTRKMCEAWRKARIERETEAIAKD